MSKNHGPAQTSSQPLATELNLRAMLAGGDRRSIGRSDEVAKLLASRTERFGELLNLIWDGDPLIAMRAADAVEKISRERGDLLQPYKAQLLGLLAESTHQEIRWHLAAMVPRLRLTPAECERVDAVLRSYLEDRSSIVKTFAMQGLADLTRQDPTLIPSAADLIRALTRTGTPAMRARGRHLLKALESKDLQD